uniref:hypothetical protein n=1 Tax=Escherichia coli TaxID=562 RepID=UPI001C40537E
NIKPVKLLSDIFFDVLHYLLPPFRAASRCFEGAEIPPVKDYISNNNVDYSGLSFVALRIRAFALRSI